MEEETLFRSVVKMIEMVLVLGTSIVLVVNFGWIPMFTFLGSLYILLTVKEKM